MANKEGVYSGEIKIAEDRVNTMYTLLGILVENGYSVLVSKHNNAFHIYYCSVVKKEENNG